MSRIPLQILGIVLLVGLVAGALFVVKQRREAHSRRQQIAEMKASLAKMRDAIGSFRAANERYPASLQDLVKYGQLDAIPTDPVTGSTTTWTQVTEERVDLPDDFSSGTPNPEESTSLIDVRSGAPGNDPEGKPWSSY